MIAARMRGMAIGSGSLESSVHTLAYGPSVQKMFVCDCLASIVACTLPLCTKWIDLWGKKQPRPFVRACWHAACRGEF